MNRIKNWLIHLLGGYTKEEYELLLKKNKQLDELLYTYYKRYWELRKSIR